MNIEKYNKGERERCPYPTAVLEVHFDRLERNIEKVRDFAAEGKDYKPKVLIPVKSGAYGAGMTAVAEYLESSSMADYLGVAHLVEAVELRKEGIKLPILILGQSPNRSDAMEAIIEYDIEQAVSEPELLKSLNKMAGEKGRKARVHLLVDTGMGRCGVLFEQVESMLDLIEALKNIELVGVMTHFSVADELDEESLAYTKGQIEKFKSVKMSIENRFGTDIIFHTSNSGGCMENRDSVFDMIRPGISVYGYPEHDFDLGLEPIMDLVTEVTLIKEYGEGHDIGYGRTFSTKAGDRIAIIPLGYGDGLFRNMSNKLEVIINDKKYKSAGRISMDQFAVLVDDDVSVGDKVRIIGSEADDNNAKIMAGQAGTISYEVICALGNARRIRKEYR